MSMEGKKKKNIETECFEVEVHYTIDPHLIINQLEKNNKGNFYREERTIIEKKIQNDKPSENTPDIFYKSIETTSSQKIYRSPSCGSITHLSAFKPQKLNQKYPYMGYSQRQKTSFPLRRGVSFYDTDKKLNSSKLSFVNPYRPPQPLLNYMKKPDFLKLGNEIF